MCYTTLLSDIYDMYTGVLMLRKWKSRTLEITAERHEVDGWVYLNK